VAALTLLLAVACNGCAGVDTADTWSDRTREPCDTVVPERQVLWGDLHVHTRLSFDAWVYDVRLGPSDAYAFAQGETVYGPPLGGDDQGTVPLTLDRPLDFAAVTDHAEYLAEIQGCTTPGSAIYDASVCVDYRDANASSIRSFGIRLANPDPLRMDLCDTLDCAGADVWQQIQDAAEDAYDRTSACRFTSFVGYEWTGATNVSNYHRNVIFKGWRVPDLPTTYFEQPTPEGLWRSLQEQCTQGLPGCAVLAIPHNSNMSNGQQFQVDPETAALRAELEPLLEIYQHKGDSECRQDVGFTPDEACDFEKLRVLAPPDVCTDPGTGGMTVDGCVHPNDFLRGILLTGLQEQEAGRDNPFRVGVIASTDTHSGTPGLVTEDAWPGHLGLDEGTPQARLETPGLNPGGVINSPGGLVAVWAEENTRESVFDALQRRETYGTSGPRITLRVHAGEIPVDACQDPTVFQHIDDVSVPMGGVWQGSEPDLLVSVLADPQGLPIEHVQVVKGWVDQGEPRIEVIELLDVEAGSVDPDTCETLTSGVQQVCVEWSDPEPPSGDAFYYVRVLEAPRCRWSALDCNSLGDDAPENCERVPTQIQERAWSSPIWVEE
jgi:hypothetical protein